MASTIILRTIGGSPEKAIQLDNSQFGRLVPMPSGWTKMRIGLRLHMGDTGADIPGTPRFIVGFARGITNLIGSGTVDHFIGARSNAVTWWRDPAPLRYYLLTATIQLIKQVGAVVTAGAGSLNAGQTHQIGAGCLASAADRQIYFFDVTKGAPNYTGQLCICNNPSLTDLSSAQFYRYISDPSPVITNHIQPAAITVACDEAVDGAFNAIQIYWNKAAASVIELCDVAVARLA